MSKIRFLIYWIDEIIYVPNLRDYPFIIDIIGSLRVLLYAHYLIFKVITKLLHKFDKQFKEPDPYLSYWSHSDSFQDGLFYELYLKRLLFVKRYIYFFSFEIYVILKSWNVSYIQIVVFECQTLVFKAVRNLTTAEPDVTQRTIYQLTNMFKIWVVWK